MKFGVREICDVTFKAAANNQKVGNKVFKKYQPVFMIDTARTSNFEQASTTVYAQGGRGYARLLAWEGEKTMTFTVEDALMSPMGLAVLSGAGLINHDKDESARVHVTLEKTVGANGAVEIELNDLKEETGLDNMTDFTVCNCIPMYATVIGATGKAEDFLTVDTLADAVVVNKDTSATLTVRSDSGADVEGKVVVIDFYLAMNNSVQTISIGPEDFGGYYYVEAQTLFRDEATGKDLAANITFPKVKIQSAFTFTMAASGDPSTFNFTMDAFPGYTIARCDKKTMCDIQIISPTGSDEDDCLACDTTKPKDDSPVEEKKTNPAGGLTITATKIPSSALVSTMIGYADAVDNQDHTTVTQNGNIITVSETGGQWKEYTSDNPAQGDAEWVGLIIDTGEDDIKKVTFDDYGTLTQDDVDEAASVGAGAGKFVLWIKGNDTDRYPRDIVLGTEGKENTTITVKVVNG